MADKDDDIEIRLEDDPKTPPADIEIKDAPKDGAKPATISGELGVEELQRRLKAERERAESAEIDAANARRVAAVAQNTTTKTQLEFVSSAAEQAKSDINVLKQQIEDAVSSGNGKALAEAQHALSERVQQLRDLEEGKEKLSKLAEQPVQTADPVELFASQLTPKSASWVRKHPEYARNPKLNTKMISAHNIAISEDIEPESPEYFARVESILGITSDPDDNPGDISQMATDPPKDPPRRAAPPAAPVTRTANNGAGRKNVVTLTAEEREIARMNGLTDKEYAQNKFNLMQEGRIGPRH